MEEESPEQQEETPGVQTPSKRPAMADVQSPPVPVRTPVRRETAATTGVSRVRAGESARVAALARQLDDANARFRRNQAARDKDLAVFTRGIRKALAVVAVAALLVAGLADLLSIIDFGWVVSWLIPIIGALYVRRINAINKMSEVIAKAAVRQHNILLATRSRVRPLAEAAGQRGLLIVTTPAPVSFQFSSYVGRFVRDTLIAQILELVPVLDWLPMYLGGVVKTLVDQRRAHKSAMAQLAVYRNLAGKIALLERFEVDAYTMLFMRAVSNSAAAVSAARVPQLLDETGGRRSSPQLAAAA